MRTKIVLSMLWLPSMAVGQTLPQGDIARMEELFRKLCGSSAIFAIPLLPVASGCGHPGLTHLATRSRAGRASRFAAGGLSEPPTRRGGESRWVGVAASRESRPPK